MNDVLRSVIAKIAVVYLDDIIIFSKGTLQDHIWDVEKVFNLIKQATLQIKIKKCKFFQKEIKFLGHKISQEGIFMDPEKIEAMQNLPTPHNLKDVQSVLGLFQYYKNFVKDFVRITGPIYLALKRDHFQWGPEQNRAFNYLKKAMTEAPILAHPDYDKEFILYTDASYTGLGFILAQKDNQGLEHPVRYGGRKLQPAERNYTITNLECLGIVWGIRKNTQFLGQNKFKLITDHKALETLKKQDLPLTARRTRWILELEQYNFDIEHRKGKKIAHVDAISRIPYNEAPVVSGPLRVTFEEPEQTEKNLPGIVTVIERDDYVTLCDPLGLATVPWWEEPPLVKLANKEDEALFIKKTEPDYVLVILYNEEGIYMSQRKNPKKPMYLKYQVPW